jgi:hypothetical protein
MAGKFQPPPIQGQKFVEEDGHPTDPLRKWLELIPPAVTSPANSGSVPAMALDPTGVKSQGIAGQMATDGNFLYVCVGKNSWKRVALGAF